MTTPFVDAADADVAVAAAASSKRAREVTSGGAGRGQKRQGKEDDGNDRSAGKGKGERGPPPRSAFDVLLRSSKLCWPSSRARPAFSKVLEVVAASGWFPWHLDNDFHQNPDHSNLRLVSRGARDIMDSPAFGGPDFVKIAEFLDGKNRFNDTRGFCDHCFRHDGAGCETCVDEGSQYQTCECAKDHRYGPALVELDPRLNPAVNFLSRAPREKAKLLLRFLRRVASNFHRDCYKKWRDFLTEVSAVNNGVDFGMLEDEPNLVMIYPGMLYLDNAFMEQFEQCNGPFYNFIHHLLFTGWADSDGTSSPFRGELLGDENDCNYWNGWHRQMFHDIFRSFLQIHKSDEEATIPPFLNDRHISYKPMVQIYTLSQIEYLPETIRRCVANTIDRKARDLLGRSIADTIDIYRLVRDSFDRSEDVYLRHIEWMPCLGMAREEFDPQEDFEGYNPQHKKDNIYGTGLFWRKQEEVVE